MGDIKFKIDGLIERSGKPYLKGFRYFLSELSPTSVYEYVSRINNFMDATGKEPEDLKLDDYTIYLGSLEDKTSSFRITTYAALKKFSLYLKANQSNSLHPMQYVSRPKFKESAKTIEKRKVGYLTQEEIKDVINNIETGIGSKRAITIQKKTKERDVAILMVFLSTGIRCNALCNLNVDDVNYDNKAIIVTDKGGKVKEYNLGEEAWVCLTAWLRKRNARADENALFINKDCERLGYRGVYNIIQKFGSSISGKNITPHKLRATYGTQLYNATKDIYFVQTCMGHSSASTTQLYIRGNNNKTKEASQIMNGLLTGI